MVVQPTECQILVRDTLQLLHLHRVLYMCFCLAQAVSCHGMCGFRLLQLCPYHSDYVLELLCCQELHADVSQPRWGMRDLTTVIPVTIAVAWWYLAHCSRSMWL
jgi:hypothetical protein